MVFATEFPKTDIFIWAYPLVCGYLRCVARFLSLWQNDKVGPWSYPRDRGFLARRPDRLQRLPWRSQILRSFQGQESLSLRQSCSTGFMAPPVLELGRKQATMLWKLSGWLRIDRKVSFVIAPQRWVRNTENLSWACSSPVQMVSHSLIFFR